MNVQVPASPYVGLRAYTEADQNYFFGREQDQETIIANVVTTPLTIFYGASGVGKSSVLLAHVVPSLRALPTVVVVAFRTWQEHSFLTTLKDEIAREVETVTGNSKSLDAQLPFDEFILRANQASRRNLILILDQFEEYFLYHPEFETGNLFDEEFARAVNREDVRAYFLLSLREDTLSRLDRFQTRIPNLMSNLLRLEYLNRDAARRAIRKPLEEYNRHLPPGQPPMRIEDGLVEAVIEQVRTGQVSLGEGGVGQAANTNLAPESSGDVRVETPYLQLVMTRLWEEERQTNSSTLRLETLIRLGGAQEIVRTHLDAAMVQFTNSERLIAAHTFRYLVTPSGTKVAYTAPDLASYTEINPAKLTPVLRKLSGSDVRLLRAVVPPGSSAQEPRYEIFHDVLAPAVLDWQERYLRGVRARRLWSTAAAVGTVLLLVIIGLVATLVYIQNLNTQNANLAAQAQELNRAILTVIPLATIGALQPTAAAFSGTSVALETKVALLQQQPLAAPTATPLPTRTFTVVPTNTPAPTEAPTLAASPTPTATLSRPTAVSVVPVATATVAPQLLTPTAQGPPTVAVVKLSSDPADIRRNQQVTFHVTFRNTFATVQQIRWSVWVYLEDQPQKTFGKIDPPIVTNLPPGADMEWLTPPTWSVRGPGGSQNFIAYVRYIALDGADSPVPDLNGNNSVFRFTVNP